MAWEPSERVLALALAPGGARLWALTPSGVRLRSDGGRGWQLGPASLADYRDLRLLGVSADGASLYLAGAGPAGDVLLEWPEGLALVGRATLAPGSFVFSSRRIAALAPAGGRLFALTSPDGVSRVGDQGAFEPLAARALCLTASNGELWRCGTQGDGALFSRSRDGVSWEPVLPAPAHHFEARSCVPAETAPEVPPFAEGQPPSVAGGCRAAPSRAPAGASLALALLALLGRRRLSR
jgi:hypothetical protein